MSKGTRVRKSRRPRQSAKEFERIEFLKRQKALNGIPSRRGRKRYIPQTGIPVSPLERESQMFMKYGTAKKEYR